MKRQFYFSLVFFCFLVIHAAPGLTQDMRAVHQGSEQKKQRLLEQAELEEKTAKEQAQALHEQIINDKVRLKNAIATLNSGINILIKSNKKIEARINTLTKETKHLQEKLAQTTAVNREFRGVVQTNAKDLKTLFLQSLQSGLAPGGHAFLEPIIQGEKFPTMDDVDKMADQLFSQIQSSGQVLITPGSIVDRKGKERMAQLLLIGNFTGIYTLDSKIGKNETGFLLYSDASQRYFALSCLPSAKVQDNISSYLKAKRGDIFMDISKGGALRQLTHQMSLVKQVPKGGAIVWPILIIFIAAFLILIERVVFFTKRRVNVDMLMNTLGEKIIADDWEGCQIFLENQKTKLIPKILLTAVALKDRTRPEIENALQEAILGEIPAIERFLSTLGMLAAIAPLLGLLGTVTGMINTFHVITYYGTGDPRMMSGGISEALVTTMLGLSVAIPIMLCHTLLSRRVETQISRMEEKSVAFVNMVFKTQATRH